MEFVGFPGKRFLPFPLRVLLAPSAFPNTARPILLKRLLRRLEPSPLSVKRSSPYYASVRNKDVSVLWRCLK